MNAVPAGASRAAAGAGASPPMRAALGGAALLWALLAPPASGHEGHREAAAAQASASAVALGGAVARDARAYFGDTELVDQHGLPRRFFSDLLDGKVVLINVIYTRCQDACPIITRALTEVRAQLGARFGTEIFFVSISSDPQRDSPPALLEFARQQDADHPGWTFLGGKPENVAAVLARLGQLSSSVEEHSTLLLAGNVPAKRWSKIRPNAPGWAIAERLILLADGAGAGAAMPATPGAAENAGAVNARAAGAAMAR